MPQSRLHACRICSKHPTAQYLLHTTCMCTGSAPAHWSWCRATQWQAGNTHVCTYRQQRLHHHTPAASPITLTQARLCRANIQCCRRQGISCILQQHMHKRHKTVRKQRVRGIKQRSGTQVKKSSSRIHHCSMHLIVLTRHRHAHKLRKTWPMSCEQEWPARSCTGAQRPAANTPTHGVVCKMLLIGKYCKTD